MCVYIRNVYSGALSFHFRTQVLMMSKIFWVDKLPTYIKILLWRTTHLRPNKQRVLMCIIQYPKSVIRYNTSIRKMTPLAYYKMFVQIFYIIYMRVWCRMLYKIWIYCSSKHIIYGSKRCWSVILYSTTAGRTTLIYLNEFAIKIMFKIFVQYTCTIM